MILEGPPQTLNEDVVLSPATAVHTDLDTEGLQHPHESPAGELCPLVGIEYLGFPISEERLFQGLDAELAVKGI